MLGFQKRTDPASWTKPRMPRLHEEVREDGRVIVACSCGWSYAHPRDTVRGSAGDRHLAKRHNGRGIWF